MKKNSDRNFFAKRDHGDVAALFGGKKSEKAETFSDLPEKTEQAPPKKGRRVKDWTGQWHVI